MLLGMLYKDKKWCNDSWCSNRRSRQKGLDYASDTNEAFKQSRSSFGDNNKVVEDWSKSTLTNIGLAQGTALDLAATYGDMSTSMGIGTEEAAKMSTSLVDLAGDLASFKI